MKTFNKILFMYIFIPLGLYAQELVTDRPDQTESAVTVPFKSLQIETGMLFENLKDNGLNVEQYSVAGTLLRYGLFENIELRLGAGYLIQKADNTNSGVGDFLLGAKINFLTEDNGFADIGLMIHAFLPAGSETFEPQKTEPEIIIAFSKSLSEKFSFASNIGGSLDSSIDEIVYLYTAAIGFLLTYKLGAYIEIFGNFLPAFAPSHYYDGGFSYLLSDDLQLDIFGGKNLSGENTHWFIGSGVSLRLQNL